MLALSTQSTLFSQDAQEHGRSPEESHKERVKFVERPHKVCGKAQIFGAVYT
jgi:hypothetical protein